MRLSIQQMVLEQTLRLRPDMPMAELIALCIQGGNYPNGMPLALEEGSIMRQLRHGRVKQE